jgi:Fur family ferric uptake transcriptional regulator
MNDPIRRLEETLSEHGYSMTNPRRTVLLVMLDHEPMSLHDLVEATASTVNRSSIYRTVDLFEKLGIIERLTLGWKYKLELSDKFAAHHHHITCSKCGKVQSFEESPTISYELKQLAQEAGYTESGHQLEIRGICNVCQSKMQ